MLFRARALGVGSPPCRARSLVGGFFRTKSLVKGGGGGGEAPLGPDPWSGALVGGSCRAMVPGRGYLLFGVCDWKVVAICKQCLFA